MAVVSMTEQTYLPEESERIGQVRDFLTAHQERADDRSGPQYSLSGPGSGDRVEVPAAVHRVLVQVVEALNAGCAVTVAPQTLSLTTQQAADLLGVSRPTVVKIIDRGELPAERSGHRRKVLLTDLLEYRETRRARQYDAIAATSLDLDDAEDPARVLAELKAIRRAAAQARRASDAGDAATTVTTTR